MMYYEFMLFVYVLFCRSGVVGVSKGNEVRYSNTIASSATKRSIDFLHTERLIPVEQPNEQETELTEESPANLTSEDQNVELQSSTTIPTNTDDVGEDTKVLKCHWIM